MVSNIVGSDVVDFSKIERKYQIREHIYAASFLVSEDCLLNCSYCFEHHKKKKMTPEIMERGIDFLIEGARKHNQRANVSLFGGEPTLAPEIIEHGFKCGVQRMEQTGVGIDFGMITNAVIMNDCLYNLFETYMKPLNFQVQLSIDGPAHIQNKNRPTKTGEPSFPMVEKSVKRYKELFKDNYRALSVHGCLTPNTIKHMYECYIFFREEWELEPIWFLPVIELPWTEKNVEEYQIESEKVYNYIMKRVRKEKNIKEIELYSPFSNCFMQRNKRPVPCGAGKTYATITADGDLYPCHQIYYNDKEGDTCIGNIWYGVDEDRRRVFSLYEDEDLSCGTSCDFTKCYRCIGSNYVFKGSMFSQIKDNYCKLMKIDQYFQEKIKREVEEMGLMKNQDQYQPGNNPDNPDCLCDSRGTQNIGCDIVDPNCREVVNNCVKVIGERDSCSDSQCDKGLDKNEVFSLALNMILQKVCDIEKKLDNRR